MADEISGSFYALLSHLLKIDALPSQFMTCDPKSDNHLINPQFPTKVNQLYHLYFPAKQPKSNPDIVLPEWFRKNTDKRESFFRELTRNKSVQGRIVSILSEEKQGLIYARCKELEKDIKIQGMVIKLDTAD